MTVDLLKRARIAPSENPWLDLPIAADIWARLMRRRRKDGRFLCPTRFHIGDTAEQRQELAIYLLFSMALDIAENPPRIISRRDLETIRTNLQTIAETQYNTVAMMVQSGLRKPHRYSSEPELHHIDPLIVAAEEARDHAAQLDRGIIIERDRGNMRERAVAVGIANVCRLLFDSTMPKTETVMPKTVVGLVKILLDRDITVPQVQYWCAANCRMTSKALTPKKNKKPISRSYS